MYLHEKYNSTTDRIILIEKLERYSYRIIYCCKIRNQNFNIFVTFKFESTMEII